jgi:hypothetical protein
MSFCVPYWVNVGLVAGLADDAPPTNTTPTASSTSPTFADTPASGFPANTTTTATTTTPTFTFSTTSNSTVSTPVSHSFIPCPIPLPISTPLPKKTKRRFNPRGIFKSLTSVITQVLEKSPLTDLRTGSPASTPLDEPSGVMRVSEKSVSLLSMLTTEEVEGLTRDSSDFGSDIREIPTSPTGMPDSDAQSRLAIDLPGDLIRSQSDPDASHARKESFITRKLQSWNMEKMRRRTQAYLMLDANTRGPRNRLGSVTWDVKITGAISQFDPKPFFAYQIRVRNGTDTWHIAKRYTRFLDLHSKLKKQYNFDAVLPTKKLWCGTHTRMKLTHVHHTHTHIYTHTHTVCRGSLDPEFIQTRKMVNTLHIFIAFVLVLVRLVWLMWLVRFLEFIGMLGSLDSLSYIFLHES